MNYLDKNTHIGWVTKSQYWSIQRSYIVKIAILAPRASFFFNLRIILFFCLIIQPLCKFQPSKQTIAVSVISLVKWCAVPTFGIFYLYSYNVPHVPQKALFVRLTAYTSFMQSVETSCVRNIMFPVQVRVVFWV